MSQTVTLMFHKSVKRAPKTGPRAEAREAKTAGHAEARDALVAGGRENARRPSQREGRGREASRRRVDVDEAAVPRAGPSEPQAIRQRRRACYSPQLNHDRGVVLWNVRVFF